MPVAGAARKPAGQSVTRHQPRHDWIDVADVPFRGGPPLPQWRPCCAPWPKAAKETWEHWRTMPHCVLWRKADWDFAFKAIELVAQLYDERWAEKPERMWPAHTLSELRDRERAMGTTLDYRRAIRVRYVDPATMKTASGEQGTVTKIADYRGL